MLEQILEARSKRTLLLESKLNSQSFIVTFGLNIPGDNKTGPKKKEFIKKYFFEYLSFMSKRFESINYDFIEDSVGYVYYIWMNDADPYEVKKMSLKFEDLIGDKSVLIDIDVYRSIFDKLSRQDLAEFPRKCFLCEQPAKVCAYKQTHSYEELLDFTEQKLNEDVKFVLPHKYILEDIVKEISQGDLQPGDRLKEIELSEKYGVSRTKIREVLKELSEYGVINLKKSMGAEIKELSKAEVIEITDLRIQIKQMLFLDVFENLDNSGFYIIKTIHSKLKKIDKANVDLVKTWNKKFYVLVFALSNKNIQKIYLEI
ncbi:hypothetical protein SCLARK_001805 [Spiroplasma clarkii]|uniref:citrate lyase holo-[acyl-carrier protein] synthase n=1 Tax=Spiroplasma clarkii TaxID=2139 RepID=UPI000B56105C|nr:citrate lyase holo-[acyl-carrier protein] synthase [Spiroplasma clarkii]ARU92250.1 hypothetical protein SCLARK_001805 [Spiroplasma clarkii]